MRIILARKYTLKMLVGQFRMRTLLAAGILCSSCLSDDNPQQPDICILQLSLSKFIILAPTYGVRWTFVVVHSWLYSHI